MACLGERFAIEDEDEDEDDIEEEVRSPRASRLRASGRPRCGPVVAAMVMIAAPGCGSRAHPATASVDIGGAAPPAAPATAASPIRAVPASALYRWHLAPSPVTATIRALAGRIAVGDGGTILTGTYPFHAWNQVPSGTTRGLHGALCVEGPSGKDKCLVVGEAGVILRARFMGQVWTAESSGTTETLFAVAQARSSAHPDIFAVGAHGTILRRDPDTERWTPVPSGTSADLRAIVPVQALAEGDEWRWEAAMRKR